MEGWAHNTLIGHLYRSRGRSGVLLFDQLLARNCLDAQSDYALCGVTLYDAQNFFVYETRHVKGDGHKCRQENDKVLL